MAKKRPAPHIRKKRKKLAQARREILKANLSHEIDAPRSTGIRTASTKLSKSQTLAVSTDFRKTGFHIKSQTYKTFSTR